MARIRSIHPGLATDEAFMAMAPITKAVWPLLWTECDDQGAFEWKPLVLKARLLPADAIDFVDILAELVRLNAIMSYEVGGKQYGLVRNFGKYQRPKKPANKYPVPSEYRPFAGLTADSSPPVPNQFPTSGENSPQREDVGGRGEGKEEEKPAQHPEPSAAARRGKSDLDRIESLCRQAAGLENAISPELFNLSPIIALLDAGYSLEGDVLPVLKAKAGKSARSWKFFVAAIEENRASNKRIAPLPGAALPDWPARAAYVQAHQWRDDWGKPEKVVPSEFRHLFPSIFDKAA